MTNNSELQWYWTLIKRTKPVGLGLLLVFLVANLIMGVANSGAHAHYRDIMAELDLTAAPAPGAGLLASYDEDEQEYSDKYIQEDLLAEEPGQVYAVIRWTEDRELVGYYSGSAGVGGYKRILTLQWYDLETQQVLAEESFEGGRPPYTIDSDTKGAQYGSYPDEEVLEVWVREQAAKFLP